MATPLPRASEGWNSELLPRLWRGEIDQADLVQLFNDPAADEWSRFHALTGLALGSGDDEEATRLFRSTLADPWSRKGDGTIQATCLHGLAVRAGKSAKTELEAGLTSRSSQVRSVSLLGLAFIGDTERYDEMLTHFERGLRRGQKKSGGFEMPDLATYVLGAVRRGVGDFDAIKALLRSNWSRIPDDQRGGFRGQFERLLPGIEDPDKDPEEVPLPALEFPSFQRGGGPRPS